MATKDKNKFDTSFYSIRRAKPKDLPLIIDLIISEPYFRWRELIQLMLSNMYVTVMWFIGALCVMGLAVFYFYSANIQYASRPFYIGLSVSTGLLIFALCFMKAYTLYFLRYIRAFEIRAILQNMDERTLNDNELILKNEVVCLFWRMNTFYIAEPYDEASKRLFLGLISLTSYIDYCKDRSIEDSDFEVIARAVPDGFRLISHKSIVISYLIVNEAFFKKSKAKQDGMRLRDSVYNGLLQYVEQNVIKDTSINYVIAESDDFLYWQHDILHCNKYGFCGERIDSKWDFYHQLTMDGFPNNKLFFIKVANIDERAFRKALEAEKKRKALEEQKKRKNQQAEL